MHTLTTSNYGFEVFCEGLGVYPTVGEGVENGTWDFLSAIQNRGLFNLYDQTTNIGRRDFFESLVFYLFQSFIPYR